MPTRRLRSAGRTLLGHAAAVPQKNATSSRRFIRSPDRRAGSIASRIASDRFILRLAMRRDQSALAVTTDQDAGGNEPIPTAEAMLAPFSSQAPMLPLAA
jgi:hypothetical protein